MKSTTSFRTVLLANIAVIIAGIVASVMLVDILPPDLQTYLSNIEEQELTTNDLVVFVISLVALILIIVSTIGVWFFKRWARSLYVAIVIILIPLTPLFGPVVMNEWEALFNDLALTLDGAVIVLMFSGSIGNKFRKKQISS